MPCESRSQQLSRLWIECSNVSDYCPSQAAHLMKICSGGTRPSTLTRFDHSSRWPVLAPVISSLTWLNRADSVECALGRYSDFSHLVRLFNRMDELSRHESHAVVLVRHCEPLSPTDLKDDRCIASFKSPYVYQKMLDNVLTLQMDEIRELYRAVRGFTAHGAVGVCHSLMPLRR